MKNARLLARKAAVYTLTALLALSSFASFANAQIVTTGRISGTVMDPQGAIVPTAEVNVKNDETGNEYKVKVGDDGTFVIAQLPIATYTVTITAPGFKQTVVTNVKTQVGLASTLQVTLEVGAASETVTVTSGAEVLQRETTNVGSTISGRQITDLPFSSRDALDLVMTLPGTATVGRPRSSSVNGLPKGALNISIDGINAQDNFLRTTDGFFTYIRPRIDAIEEVQVSLATPGAEASAGGAVHIRFVTKGGTNEYHGGGWWYNRQRVYNTNYYFNKIQRQEATPGCDRTQPGCLVETPRAQVMLNQWGLKVGGPLTPWLKDKVFFFVSYDEFRLPEQQIRSRVILTPEAEAGEFKYRISSGEVRSVNLLALAAARNNPLIPGTKDPTIAGILSQIRESTAKGALTDLTDPNQQSFTFTNTGGQTRRFPTIRLDANVTSNHHVEMIYNYQDFASQVDFLNARDPAFPEPIPQILGSQGSDRFSFATALRSQLTSKIVNEARFGLTGGTVVFFPEMGPASYDPFGGVALTFPGAYANPHNAPNNSRRNSPIKQFNDNLSWIKGRHNFNFGASYTGATSYQQSSGGNLAPNLSFNILSADPANALFTAANFPGASATQLNDARGIYALLTGKISAVTFNAKLDEETLDYSFEGTAVERNKVTGYGFYFQDYFKLKPNLNINYGLRWEAALAPVHRNGVYVRPGFEGLFSVSGSNGLFNPNASGGAPTEYFPVDENTKPFDDDMNNFAPSLGIAWSPQFKNSMLKKLFGEGEQTVLRAAYSISYVTGGFADFNGIWNSNPGLTSAAGARPGIEFTAGSLLLRDSPNLLRALPQRTFPLLGSPGIAAVDFDPNIESPYVQSWSFGMQRELNRDTVFEARYVGNRSIGLGRTYNLNEVNIFENGFLQEFNAALNNLNIFRAANPNCDRVPGAPPCSFRNTGLPGQVNLPIFTASFGAALANFTNTTFKQLLDQGQAGNLANQLSNVTNNIAFQNNRLAAGFTPNFFLVNPNVLGGGSFLATNDAYSSYNALQIELRRRFANGLLVQGNYTWSHSLTDIFGSGGTIQPHTLRDKRMDKGPSPFDIRHAFKANWIYELPIGPGHRFDFSGGNSVLGKILGGWETDGIIRWQSGRVFNLTSGRATVNQFDSGLVLVGISQQELQDMVKIRKLPNDAALGTVTWLPRTFIQNTLRAFGLGDGKTPIGPHFAPPTTPGQFGSYIFLYGPSLFRADLSLVKKTRIRESMNIETRVEFLNAFNTTNFLIGNAFAADVANTDQNTITVNSANFGQTTHAYRDVSTTNDPGGRLLQLVLRINF
ncbi:MAG TPA: TonB-dependent receptor [Blastocatellia bacterium]|nr:TonB-dependent receptor [Blastocatellia bacterium]